VTAVSDTGRFTETETTTSDWQLYGACRRMDSEVFFHPEGERGAARARREAHAKAVCEFCPVVAQCRAHGLAAREPYGIWGGLSPADRDVIARRVLSG
jgi:WhiB family redox-sensing transcriptional regulator